ncbi:Endo-1,4-beta-xylanase A precursor [compost metagenome]
MIRKFFIGMTVTALTTACITATTASAALPTYGEEWQNAETTQQTINFTDLPSTHWASKYITEMVNRKVISGYPDGRFRPNSTITRAEFAKIMITASGITPKKVNYSSFSDIPATNWASPFVESVKDYMTGYRTADGKYIFNPSAPATREDVAVAPVKLKGYDTNRLPDQSTIEAMFKDYAGISESAKSYVALAVENGLVSGFQDETFRPQATVTRAEATVMLWRAYQYGNDNKEIGGGQTTTNPTPTPTTPSTPNTSTPVSSAPTTPTEQPSMPSAKFTVETLVGGSGTGDVDGPVRTAKINQIDSMIVDKNNNIYFLDQHKRKVRKFNSSNGTVETFKAIDSQFDWSHTTVDKNMLQYNHEDFTPSLLGYSSINNKLYLLGQSSKKYSYDNDFIFDITSNVKMATYILRDDADGNVGYSSKSRTMSFINVPDDNTIYYGYDGAWKFKPSIFAGGQGNEAGLIGDYNQGTSIDFFGKSDALVNDNAVFIFDTGNNTLSKISLFPRKVETIVTLSNTPYDSVTNHSGKFYLTAGATVYELTTDGKLNTFIQGKDLIYNDGKPVQQISQMAFDSNDNVIFYDDNSKSIRRINL